jgi:hypothetical protein
MRNKDVLELADKFGLRKDPTAFELISEAAALSLVASILHRDMAYSHAMMTEDRAKELAERFLGLFGSGARFFSNGWPGGWNPATEATFDTGVLVIGDEQSGCIWVEDED